MKPIHKLVLEDSFDATGTLRHEGEIGMFDADRLNGKEKHLAEIDGSFSPAIVEASAIAPTGPNPTAPQQIPPDASQGAGGAYALPGKVIVGEVTRPAEERIDAAGLGEDNIDKETKVTEMLADAKAELLDANTNANVSNELVEGTVADVTADLGGKTDDELSTMRAQEVDREKPRVGVLKAIDAELKGRQTS